MTHEQDSDKLLQLGKELNQAMQNEEREKARKRLGLDENKVSCPSCVNMIVIVSVSKPNDGNIHVAVAKAQHNGESGNDSKKARHWRASFTNQRAVN